MGYLPPPIALWCDLIRNYFEEVTHWYGVVLRMCPHWGDGKVYGPPVSPKDIYDYYGLVDAPFRKYWDDLVITSAEDACKHTHYLLEMTVDKDRSGEGLREIIFDIFNVDLKKQYYTYCPYAEQDDEWDLMYYDDHFWIEGVHILNPKGRDLHEVLKTYLNIRRA